MTHTAYHATGPIHFITTVVAGRCKLLTSSRYVIPLYDSLLYYTATHPCRILGYVFMPDHIHLLLWPAVQAELPDLMRDFKTFTAKRILRQAEAEHDRARLAHFDAAGAAAGHSEHKVWQDGSWEQDIFTERFVRQKLVYMHRNPVRAGLVDSPDAYPYSSYVNYQTGKDAWLPLYRAWM